MGEYRLNVDKASNSSILHMADSKDPNCKQQGDSSPLFSNMRSAGVYAADQGLDLTACSFVPPEPEILIESTRAMGDDPTIFKGDLR